MRITLRYALLFCLFLSLYSPNFANDNCATPTVKLLTPTGCTIGNSTGATDDGVPAPTCWDAGPYDDVWYTLTTDATPSVAYQFLMANGAPLPPLGPLPDPAIGSFQFAIYETDPCGGAGIERYCSPPLIGSDQFTGTPFLALNPSTTYWIRIDGAGTDEGRFYLCHNQATQGQVPCSAEIIPAIPSPPTAYTTCGATNSITGGCPGGDGNGEDYWFVYTSLGDEYISLILTASDPLVETVVSVFTATDCESGMLCYGSEAAGGNIAAVGETDAYCKHIYMRDPGDYFFSVDVSGGGNCSAFTMEWGTYVPTDIDTCGGADTLTTTPLPSGNTQCEATPGNDDQFVCPFTIENSVWYTFSTGLVASNISIHVDNPDCSGPVPAGWQFNLLNGDCSSLTHMACHSSTDGSDWSMPIGVTPLTTYYVMMDGFNGSACNYDIYITGDVLPVEYVYQEASNYGNYNLIKWETSIEVDSRRFIIERSIQNAEIETEQFEMIGSVDSKNKPSSYEFVDQATDAGSYIYRLTQEDQSGAMVATINLNVIVPAPTGFELVGIYPNPVKDVVNFNLEIMEERPASISIFDLNGKKVKTVNDLSLSPGYQNIELDVSNLKKGYYFYSLEFGEFKTNGKILKM